MSGSIESLRASVRVTDGACNDHDFICRCKPVDVRFALQEIERLQAVVDAKLHVRRCHDCGHEFYAAAGVVPYCLCDKCGSQDTRKRTR